MAKRAQLQNILTMAAQSPLGMTFFESPDNWEEILKLQGFPELTLTPALAYEKQTAEIEELLGQNPVAPTPDDVQQAQIAHASQGVQAVAQGLPAPPFMPPQPKASVPIQPLDYHKWEYAKCQEFLSSERARREKAQGNDAGLQNVLLHAMAHKQAMMAEMMQQAALAPPPPGPPKPPNLTTHAPEANKQVQKQSTPPGAATL